MHTSACLPTYSMLESILIYTYSMVEDQRQEAADVLSAVEAAAKTALDKEKVIAKKTQVH